ncbi:MAG: asparagine synthase-related protein [Actinomycetaceae bacterium]|nr:asparagine synthase-related protein [Actinomycetaceae bacterium]
MALIVDRNEWRELSLHIGRVYWRSSIPHRDPIDFSTSNIADWARAQRGNWSAVIDNDEGIHLVVDAIRSFPILYTRSTSDWLISSSANPLLEAVPECSLDQKAAAEFRHSGFVLGTDTLIRDVRTVTAGQAITLHHNGDVTGQTHSPFIFDDRIEVPIPEFFENFHRTLLDTFGRLIDDACGRQLLIPLSGGADSRLILALLRELDAPNVLTFTYGVPNSREASISRQVAAGIDFPWLFVPINPSTMAKRWKQPKTASFLQSAWSGNALPHIQDWFAITELVRTEQIDFDAIVLPGHTVVGNQHDAQAIDPHVSLDYRGMTRLLSRHHLSLQGHPEIGELSAYSRTKIVDFLRAHWPNADPEMKPHVVAAFNIAERQAKYISNSVRTYEHCGLSWALPMEELPVWELWLRGPSPIHDEARTHYVRYANEQYAKWSGDSLGYFDAPAQRLPSGPVHLVRTALQSIGALDWANAMYRATVELKHPMGYEALVGDMSRPALARRLFTGRSILGVYADLFLTNSWVPSASFLP